MHEEWTDRLSDYLDGELEAGVRNALESHLFECAACRAVLEELNRVVAGARSIQPRPPHVDLWQGIAERIETQATTGNVATFQARSARQSTSVSTRRISFSLPQLAAAAVLLMALSGGLVWLAVARPGGLRDAENSAGAQARGDRSTSADVQARPDGGANSDAQVRSDGGSNADFQVRRDGDDVQMATIGFADQQYDAAVADLEKALNRGRGRLDASTVAVVEHNLQIIDQAIAQARQALAADPANGYLSSHLVEARRRKLDLLRRAAALTGETD